MPIGERDLKDIISFEGFDYDHYQRDEQAILKPRMQEHGYSHIMFYEEVVGDTVLRKCKATASGAAFSLIGAEGKEFVFYYG